MLKTSAMVVLSSVCCFAAIEAAPFRYTISVTGSGSLGETAFEDQELRIEAIADTDNLYMPRENTLAVLNDSTALMVQGLGTAMFTNEILTVRNGNYWLAGFGDRTQDIGLLFLQNQKFFSYDLASDLGPLSGRPVTNVAGFPTTLGAFQITSVRDPFGEGGTFTARQIPEPSSHQLWLIALVFWSGHAIRAVFHR